MKSPLRVSLLLLTVCALLPGQDIPAKPLKAGEILSRTFETIPEDFQRMATAPFAHPGESAMVAGGLLLLVATDRMNTRAFQDHVEPNIRYTLAPLWKAPSSAIVSGADTWLVGTIPLWYLGSLAAGSSQGQTAAVLSAKAVTYSWLVANVTLKSLFARVRPLDDLAGGTPEAGRTDNPWKWGQFHHPYLGSRPDKATGFPSFHFTVFFAVAEVFHEEYGNSWIPYLLAMAGLGSDIRGHMHWVSDMTAGTLLGLGIGHTVVQTFHGTAPKKIGKAGFSIKPWTDMQGQSGLALTVGW